MLQRHLGKQRQQQLERMSRSSRKANYLPGLLIVLLVLLQNFELHMCRQLMRRSSNSLLKDNSNNYNDNNNNDNNNDNDNIQSLEKRSVAETSGGQPEEIFSAPNDASDMSYDEYPVSDGAQRGLKMVVPKRAALLLDRLMVALHHALENEHYGHRIGEFYANKNMLQVRPTEFKAAIESLKPTEEGISMPSSSHNFHMYSDDDPSVLLDYDFKDLNQINRATGETLMAKSFQRRAGGIMANMDVATTTTSGGTATAAGAGANPGVGGGVGGGSSSSSRRIHHAANGGGRMYWRCYFNAVSCF